MLKPEKPLGRPEFIVLIATLISLVALTIDIILPAMPDMGAALGVAGSNDVQLVIGLMFVGLGIGQLIAGPLSDSFGRKPVTYLFLLIFAVGSAVCILAPDFDTMLIGRFLQGLGVAGPRIVMVAMVRDLYAGRGMAQIMSFVMAVFIIVPVVAPALGQGILLVAHWRTIFVVLLVMAGIGFLWLAFRQPETLAGERRRPFSLFNVWAGVVEVCKHRVAIGYTVSAGIIFGAFVAYLATSQQIFDQVYGKGPEFPLYFAILSLGFGAASITNANLVLRFGMRVLSTYALVALTLWCQLFLALIYGAGLEMTLWVFMGWAIIAFFSLGMLFSNFNALAMEPLGHIAGIGAAVIGFGTTLISSALGIVIGQMFDGTVVPLIAGFGMCGLVSLVVVKLTERGQAAVGTGD